MLIGAQRPAALATVLLLLGAAACSDDGDPADGPQTKDSYPTFVNLDWSKFPKDRGPDYAVSGTTWHVATSGKDSNPGTAERPFRSIVKGVQRAKAGDKVVVGAGTYLEGFPEDHRALVLKQNDVILTAAAGATVTVKPKSANYRYGITIIGDSITVNGINLDGFSYSIQVGRQDSTQKAIVISNLTIKAPASGFAEGINAYFDTTSKGFPTSEGLLLKQVKVLGMQLGISCNHGTCSSWRLEDVTVVGKGGTSSGADAIAIESGDNFFFLRVDVSGAAADGIDTKATRVAIWDSHVHELGRNGIKLWHGGDIVNTVVHHTGADAAIVTEKGPRARFLHSVLAFHKKGGIVGYNMSFGYDSQAAQTVEIINSIIYNTNGGIYINEKSKPVIKNSLFFGVDNGDILSRGSTKIKLTGVNAIKSKGWGDGNIVADPKLTSSYHLSAGSPAIDAGEQLEASYPESDMAGRPRIKGAGPDLGAHEEF